MKNFGKVAGINLGILLLYSLVIRLITMRGSSDQRPLGIMIFSAVVVGLHVLVCLLTSLSAFGSRNNEIGRVWLGTTGVVLLVGFSVCLGNASLG
jgi:hypothetical protein